MGHQKYPCRFCADHLIFARIYTDVHGRTEILLIKSCLITLYTSRFHISRFGRDLSVIIGGVYSAVLEAVVLSNFDQTIYVSYSG